MIRTLILVMIFFVNQASAQNVPKSNTEESRSQIAKEYAESRAQLMKMRSQLSPLLKYDAMTLFNAFKIKIFDTFNGCEVFSTDSFDNLVYLGKVTDKYSSESIFNEYGPHGSQYSSESIWNQYGQYGGEYSSKSPFNPYTSTPPVIACNDKTVALLSVNKRLQNALDPFLLKLAFSD